MNGAVVAGAGGSYNCGSSYIVSLGHRSVFIAFPDNVRNQVETELVQKDVRDFVSNQ